MAETKITYESLQEDPDFLDAAFHSMRAMGYNIDPENPKEIVDKFIENRRYFDVNLISTISQGNTIVDLPDMYKKFYKHALNKMEKMPDFYDEGGTGWTNALGDYLGAGFTDPTNWASALAAFFTAGAGSALIQGGKEAAKQTVRHALKSRIQSVISPRLLKAYLAEGVVAGAGAGVQEFGLGTGPGRQGVDIDLGRKKEYDLGEGAKRILLEGTLSPVLGVTGNFVLGSVKDAVISPALKSKFAKSVADQTGIAQTANWLKNNLAPLSSLDEISVRLSERATGESRPVMELVEKLTTRMDDTIKKEFTDAKGKTKPKDLELINYAMGTSGKEKPKISASEALTKLRRKSPELANQIKEFHGYVRELQEMAGSPAHLSVKGKNIYKYDPKKPYARDVFEKFVNVKREDFDKWLKLPENQSIKSDLFEFARKDKNNWGSVNEGGVGLFNKKGKPIFKTPEEKEEIIDAWLKELYKPTSIRKSKRGPTKAKQDEIPHIIQHVYGKNFNPAIRALETTKGIVESSAQLRLASSLGDSLIRQGRAVIADSSQAAARKLGTDDEMVPLVTVMDQATKQPKNLNSSFILDSDMFNKNTLGKIYVPKKESDVLKIISEQFDGRKWELGESRFGEGVNQFLDLFAGIQGYIKKNKTVYSLMAQARNALSATQYVIGTGNGRGIFDGIKLLATASPERKKEIFDVINKLGLKGSQVEIGQILNRIGELDNIKDMGKLKKVILNFMTFGTPWLESTRPGKAFGKLAQKAYVATDDIGKIASFLRERKRSEKIWNARSAEEKNILRQKFSDAFGVSSKTKDFDSKLLDEEAVSKVMNIVPVYSRIPQLLEKSRGVPVVGSFTAFPAENLRNKYNLFKLAGTEIAEGRLTGNKTLFRSGLNRLASQAVVASAPSIAAYTYNQMEGTDKVANSLRKSSAPWERNHALAIRKDKKTGKYYYSDLSYNMPDQYALDFIMPFITEVAEGGNLEESLDKNFKEMIIRQAEVFLDPSLAVQQGQTSIDLIKSMNKGDWDSAGDYFTKLWKLGEPGYIKTAREMGTDLGAIPDTMVRNFNKLYFGEDRKYLEDSGSLSTWLAKHGFNAQYSPWLLPWTMASKEREFNPTKNLGFTTKTLIKNSDEVRNIGLANIKEQLLDKSLPVDWQYIAKTYDNILSTEFAAYQQVAEVLGSYKEFMNSREWEKLIRNKDATSSLSKESMSFLRRNLYNVSSTKGLSSLKNDLLKDIKKRNPNINLKQLRNFFIQIEKPYYKRRLSLDVPEPVEVEE